MSLNKTHVDAISLIVSGPLIGSWIQGVRARYCRSTMHLVVYFMHIVVPHACEMLLLLLLYVHTWSSDRCICTAYMYYMHTAHTCTECM